MQLRLGSLAALVALSGILAAGVATAQTTSEEMMPPEEMMMGPSQIPVRLNEYSIDGRHLVVSANVPVILNLNNAGRFDHALKIAGQGDEWASDNVASGGSAAWEVTFAKPGIYQVWCPIEFGSFIHKDIGMVGTLTVVGEGDPVMKVPVMLGNFWVLPISGVMVAGQATRIELQNVGQSNHALVIKGQGGQWESERVAPGASGAWDVTLEAAGTYEIYCPIGDGFHKRAGVVGTLEVLPSGAPAPM